MTIRQLSIFLENKTGYLNNVLSILAENNINITALTVADTSDYGIVRMIVSDPEKAFDKLKIAGHSVKIHDIISLELDLVPGSLSHILTLFTAADISIEYVYAFSFGSKSIAVLRSDNREKTMEVIKKHNLKTITEEDLK